MAKDRTKSMIRTRRAALAAKVAAGFLKKIMLKQEAGPE
jgi:hypothetical protein